MVLKEIGKMEQRYDAVLAVVRDGLSVVEAALAAGVSRQNRSQTSAEVCVTMYRTLDLRH